MRHRWVPYLAAAAAVVALIAALAPASRTSDALPSMAPNLSTLGLEYSPGSGPDPAPGPDGFAVVGGEVGGLAALGRTLVAVGWAGAQPATPDGPVPEPAAWWSTDDGATWTRARLGGRGLLRAVVAQDGRFVAVGATSLARDGSALVLTSADGRTWREQRVDGGNVKLSTAVAGPGGPILAGSRDGQEGPAPYVFIPDGQGWRGRQVRPGGQQVWGEVRGGCVNRGRMVLVGDGFDTRAVGRSLVVESADHGATWTGALLRRGVLESGAASAVGCTFASQRLTVAGNVAVDSGQRGFVVAQSESRDAWDDPVLLPHPRESSQADSAARAITTAGSKLVVVGSDASTDPQGDGAVWWGGPKAESRLPGLEESVSQKGSDEVAAVLAYRGILVIGASQSFRPVVVRSSPKVAVLRTTGTERTADWWKRYAAVEPCSLLDRSGINDLTGRSDLESQPAPVIEGYVSCAWVDRVGGTVLTVELAPPERLARLRDAVFHDVGAARPVSSNCTEGAYYPTFRTVAGRCGQSAVAVSGIDENHAAPALNAVDRQLSRQ